MSLLKRFVRLAAHTQLMPILESGEETLVGGQAVLEGVMMRSPNSYCVAVRKPNGEIVTQEAPLARVADKYPIFKLPVFRGVGTLGQAMWLGIKALRFAANHAVDEAPSGKGSVKSAEIPSWVMALNLIFSFGFFIFLYKLVPLYLTTLVAKVFPAVEGQVMFNVVDGVIRLGIFLAFLYTISRWADIRRVFQYHGAEHKVVFNFESGKPVTVDNARAFATWHPRCGTSFLLVVMVISMAVYAALPLEGFVAKFIARIALLPVIAGLSYELIRYAAKHQTSLMAFMTLPGLWLQRITTQPPSDEQTEIAIRALDGAMELEKQQGGQLVIA